MEASDGLELEFVCDNYFQELEESANLGAESANLGATVFDSAIQLSLKYLNSKLLSTSKVLSGHNLYHMYVSLCVLLKQQSMPGAVLGPLWGVDDKAAVPIAQLFKSMGLGTTFLQENGESRQELGLRIHDLLHDFCRHQAQ